MSTAVAPIDSADAQVKETPNNLSAEAAVIGTILYDNNALGNKACKFAGFVIGMGNLLNHLPGRLSKVTT